MVLILYKFITFVPYFVDRYLHLNSLKRNTYVLIHLFLFSQAAKPNVNVGTIGHVDHGKTTLSKSFLKTAKHTKYFAYFYLFIFTAAAITKVLSKHGRSKFIGRVMRVGSDTFGDPFILKVLQN